jgi:hypothetical protein
MWEPSLTGGGRRMVRGRDPLEREGRSKKEALPPPPEGLLLSLVYHKGSRLHK